RPYLIETRALSGGGGTIYSRMRYDELNRMEFQSFPSFSSSAATGVEISYDGLGRVISERENVSPYATTNTSYLSGNRVRVADPEGNVTTTTYSGYGSPDDGNPIRTDQPEGFSTSMSYDIYGNLLNATQSGITQTWAYDNRLRLQSHYTPEQGCWIYGYNNANERTSIAHGPNSNCAASNGSTTISSYDLRGRLTNINYPSGTTDVAMTYDANGNILTNVRGPASWTYTWDENDQLLTETLRIDGKTFAMGHTYNSNGARSRWTAPNGAVWDFYPDGHGRRTGVVSAAFNWNLLSGATYHPNGELKRISYWNGLFYESTQNARQQIDYIHHAFVLRQNINYDNNGRITRIDDWNDNSRDRDYTYDGLGRLKTANGPWGNGSYTYNNRNNITRKQLGSRVVDIQYDNTNRVQRHRDSFNGNAWQNHVYDTRGNATDNGPINFAYDWANQPTSMSGSDSGAFTYDGNYKRVKQVINGNTSYSVYDLDGVLVWRETNGWPVSELSVGGQSTRIGGSAPNIHKDLLGSPVAATDFNGVAWREDYTPFGESRLNPTGNEDSHNFTGHIKDNDTGLVYMQARYYDPVIGRFLSTDPVGFAQGGVGYFNRYAYTQNDPVNNIDPTGMTCTGSRITNDNGTCASTGGFTTGLTGIVQGNQIRQSQQVAAQPQLGNPRFAGALKNLADVTVNRLNGKAAEDAEAAELQSQGFTVAREVTFLGPASGRRARLDIVAFKELAPDVDGSPVFGVRFIEVKSGLFSRLTRNQRAVFPEIARGTAIPVGANVPSPPLIPGTQIIFQTRPNIPTPELLIIGR
ncbi:MAG: RHS repeat-associated core domain-containing protein, partial [Pseudomonadota bacterium]